MEAGTEDLPGEVRQSDGASGTSEELHVGEDGAGGLVRQVELGEAAHYEQT